MALSLLRHISWRPLQSLHLSKRYTGYLVLIPEIGEDITDKNPLLAKNGYPEFNDITIEKCIATISQQALEFESGLMQLEIQAKDCKNIFKDIFIPIEKLEDQLELAWGIAKTLYLGNNILMPTETYIKIHQRAHNARASKFNNQTIYKAIIQENKKDKSTTDEEDRVLKKYALEGRLNGLEVKGSSRERLSNVLMELQTEKQYYRDKVNHATKSFGCVLTTDDVVREFPENLLKAMASDSSDPGTGPWKVTLQPHIYDTFMEYCPERKLRWNVWNGHVGRCSAYTNPQFETSTHLEKIRSLRHEQANILGFKSFVEMSMETKMAKNIENVNTVIDTLLEKARPKQDLEIDSLQRFAEECGFDNQLDHYDIPYWQRKQKRTLYSFDEEKIREYFPLPKVLNSLFDLCNELFDIRIIERTNISTWHKDVKFYDILLSSDTNPIASFYFDPYAREDNKIRVYNDAGWHVVMKNKCRSTGALPLSALIFNFQMPEFGKPSLLSFQEVNTLFQRFGHALRHLLTTANYSEVAGLSNVEWDAAEVCGQVMINWLYDPDVVQSISSHYASEEPLPDMIIQNLRNVRRHMAGYNLCKELYLSKLDLELYSTKTYWRDITRNMWAQYHAIPFDKYDSHPLSFTQIVTDEWAAAYYCHFWSKMIASDIFSAFSEAKLADKDVVAVGKRYRDTFLALGGSCHPSEVFRRFRGRDPSPNALLNDLGLFKMQTQEDH